MIEEATAFTGPWTFVVHDTSRTVDAAGGRAYSQDECSSFDGGVAGY